MADRRRAGEGSGRPAAPARGGLELALVLGTVLGALCLLVGEFTALATLKTTAGAVSVRSVSTGSHHSYAVALIALLALFLAYGVWEAGSRTALLAIGVLGVVVLLIALVGDLPDAQRSGLVRTSSGRYVAAASSPSAGLYLETLGGAVLVITSVSGFILIGPPAGSQRAPRPRRDDRA